MRLAEPAAPCESGVVEKRGTLVTYRITLEVGRVEAIFPLRKLVGNLMVCIAQLPLPFRGKIDLGVSYVPVPKTDAGGFDEGPHPRSLFEQLCHGQGLLGRRLVSRHLDIPQGQSL